MLVVAGLKLVNIGIQHLKIIESLVRICEDNDRLRGIGETFYFRWGLCGSEAGENCFFNLIWGRCRKENFPSSCGDFVVLDFIMVLPYSMIWGRCRKDSFENECLLP